MSARRSPVTVTLRAALVTLGALSLLACDHDEDSGSLQVNENAFVWHGVVRPGGTVMVREARGGIEVVPTTGDTVRVTARTEWRRGDPSTALTMSASQDTNGVLICAIWANGKCTRDSYTSSVSFGRRGGNTDARVFFRVELPAGVRLDLTNIDGSITAAASAPVKAQTMNGNVTVVTAVGPVRAETMNGSVDARMSSLTGTDSVIVKTMNGDAYVYLPEGIAASIDLSVTNGRVSTDFPVTVQGELKPKRLQAVLGAGTHPVRVRSMNGRVELRRLDAQGRSYQQP